MQRYGTTYRPQGGKKGISPRTLIYAATLATGMTLAGIIGANADKIDDIAYRIVPPSMHDSGYNGDWVSYTATKRYLWNVAEKCPQNRDIRNWITDIRERNDLEGLKLNNFGPGMTIEIPKPCAD